MKNNKKKGFTLVELLVVIAIIAILATVSVVGYTAFLTKANESNAMTELSQIKDAVNAAVLDGEESVFVENGDADYTVDFTYANGDLTAKVGNVAATEEQIKAAMLKLTEMDGADLTVNATDIKDNDGNAIAATVDSVDYKYGDATVTWDVATGKVQ